MKKKMCSPTSNKPAMSRKLSFTTLPPGRNLKVPKLEIGGDISTSRETVTRKPLNLSTECSSSTAYKGSQKTMSNVSIYHSTIFIYILFFFHTAYEINGLMTICSDQLRYHARNGTPTRGRTCFTLCFSC